MPACSSQQKCWLMKELGRWLYQISSLQFIDADAGCGYSILQQWIPQANWTSNNLPWAQCLNFHCTFRYSILYSRGYGRAASKLSEISLNKNNFFEERTRTRAFTLRLFWSAVAELISPPITTIHSYSITLLFSSPFLKDIFFNLLLLIASECWCCSAPGPKHGWDFDSPIFY